MSLPQRKRSRQNPCEDNLREPQPKLLLTHTASPSEKTPWRWDVYSCSKQRSCSGQKSQAAAFLLETPLELVPSATQVPSTGMDGWRMAPASSRKAVAQLKRLLHGNQCQQKQKAQFGCASPSAPWVQNQEGFSWHFKGWGGLSFTDRGWQTTNLSLDSF